MKTKQICVPQAAYEAMLEKTIFIDGKEFIVAYGPSAADGMRYASLMPLKGGVLPEVVK